MSGIIALGDVTSKPGTIQYGRWEALGHPTGQGEFLPGVIAQGKRDGPCMWLTAGIHGVEHAGPLVIHRLLTQDLVDQLRGMVVALPALSPASLRTKARQPNHAPADPNRLGRAWARALFLPWRRGVIFGDPRRCAAGRAVPGGVFEDGVGDGGSTPAEEPGLGSTRRG